MPPGPAFTIPSQRVEPYNDIEIRIQAAVAFVNTSKNSYPNIAEIARQYEIPIHRFRARLQGRQSRTELSGTNRKLSADQALAVCQYLHRLDVIGTCARMQMVTSCANRILHNAHTGPTPASLVSEQWAPHFLLAIPSIIFENNKLLRPIANILMNPMIFATGLLSIWLSVSNIISSVGIYTTSTRLVSVSASVTICGLLLVIQRVQYTLEARPIESLLLFVRQ